MCAATTDEYFALACVIYLRLGGPSARCASLGMTSMKRRVTCPVQPLAKRPIHSLLLDEIEAHLATINERPYRAKQIVDWLYEKRVNGFEAMSDLPQALRERLAQEFGFDNLETVRVLGSKDTTRKFLFRLTDGSLVLMTGMGAGLTWGSSLLEWTEPKAP